MSWIKRYPVFPGENNHSCMPPTGISRKQVYGVYSEWECDHCKTGWIYVYMGPLGWGWNRRDLMVFGKPQYDKEKLAKHRANVYGESNPRKTCEGTGVMDIITNAGGQRPRDDCKGKKSK